MSLYSIFLASFVMIIYFVATRFVINASSSNYSIRFNGTPSSYVSIPLDSTPSLNVGAGDFTIEWWMKPASVSAGASNCTNGVDVFTQGHIIFDRDVFGAGDYGDFGVALMADRRLAFSAHNGVTGVTACSLALNLDKWYYVAVVRAGDQISIYVDGGLHDTQTIAGNLSYRVGRSTSYSADPYIVLGAEKHTAIGGQTFTAYHYDGYLDDLRISNVARTISETPTNHFLVDGHTVALFRFENNVNSELGLITGLTSSSVTYSNDVPPFDTTPTPSDTPTPTPSDTPTPTPSDTPTPTPSDTPTPTPSNTPTPTPSDTPTPTPSDTPTPTPSNTPTPTPSDTPTPTPSDTPTPTPSNTPTPTPSDTPTPTPSNTPTPTPSDTPTPTPSNTPTPTSSDTPTPTPSGTPTPTPSSTLAPTNTVVPTFTPSIQRNNNVPIYDDNYYDDNYFDVTTSITLTPTALTQNPSVSLTPSGEQDASFFEVGKNSDVSSSESGAENVSSASSFNPVFLVIGVIVVVSLVLVLILLFTYKRSSD